MDGKIDAPVFDASKPEDIKPEDTKSDVSIYYASIKELSGIGPKKAANFQKLSLFTMNDVLYAYPRDYENRSNRKMIDTLINEESAFVVGEVMTIKKGRYIRGRKQTMRILVKDDTGMLEVVFFNAGYISKSVKAGDMLWFFGKATVTYDRVQMVHPQWGKMTDNGDEHSILPIYPLTEGISQNDRRKVARQSIDLIANAGAWEEYLPAETLSRNQLCGVQYAIENIHFPESGRMQLVAKYRLIFEEFLILQAGLLSVKNKLSMGEEGVCFDPKKGIDAFLERIPYHLTGAQERTVSEILADMESSKIMNRLVQGDVGSGKTAVAAAAIYKAITCGYQAVLMAPTEILARQHLQTFLQMFGGLTVEWGGSEFLAELFGEDAYMNLLKLGLHKPVVENMADRSVCSESGVTNQNAGKGYPIRVGFLSGSLTTKERRAVLADLEEGKIHLLIGTHALIQPDVNFQSLGLVVTDEQHRFGVSQRERLNQKGENCDVLVMTATPIPRTLALTLYGDLDISIIDEKPAGRKEIKTAAFETHDRMNAYRYVRRELAKGRQAYVVAPLIEASEEGFAKSAEELYDELKNDFPQYQVALLHGKMKQYEKDEIMGRFQKGEIQMLVSTVVIEVGINVPNASVMVIENAERFGLAQMHQLRGRVGRGEHQSYCMLISAMNTDVAKKRAEVMVKTNDGFEIAEKDLVLRGPGEFFGTRQHGIPELKIADLVRHPKILKAATDEAKTILKEDPFLESEKNKKMKERMEQWFQSVDSLER